MSSSDSSDSDFDMDMDDVNEGAQVRVQVSVQQSVLKTIEKEDSFPSEIEEEDEDMDDWDDDSQALSIYKQPPQQEDPPKPLRQNKFYHLFDEPKKKKPSKLNVEERFYKYRTKVNEKIQNLAKILEEKEIVECSFKPTILNKGKTRSVPEFLNNMARFDEKRKEKIQKTIAENEKEMMKVLKKPKLCIKSRILASVIPHEGISHLSKAKSHSSTVIDTNPYKPIVNPRSHDLLREKPTTSLLYEDAVRRFSKSISEDKPITESLTSQRSEKVLLEKFKKEFSEVLNCLDLNNSKALNYTKFTSLLYNMNFISRSSSRLSSERQLAIKIWSVLEGEKNGEISHRNLLTLLICVLNYKDPNAPTHSLSIGLGRMVNGIYCVAPKEVVKIHQYFYILYAERNNYSPASSDLIYEEVSFSATRKKSDTKYEDMLILEKSRLQDKWEKIRQEKALEETSGCTFQPKIKRGPRTLSSCSELNDSTASQYTLYSETKSQTQRRTDILHDYSKVFNQQKHNSSKVQLDLKSISLTKPCTFKPKLEKRIKVEEVPEAKGVKQLINRLRNARKSKQFASTEKPFLFGLENLTPKLSIDLNSSIGSNSSRNSVLDKSYVSESESISIRINLPNGKKTFCKVRHGDDKAVVLKQFVEKHGLKPEMENKLKEYLKGLVI